MSNIQKKTSSFMLTAFISLIIISFMFTGYESFRGTPDTVAQVGSESIKYSEYKLEFDRQVKMFQTYYTGGKNLTSKQIQQFKLKDRAIKGLVSKKLLMNFSDQLGITPSKEQIISQIKAEKYFKTNDVFDIKKYKILLANNRLTPADFEKDTADRIKGMTSQSILQKLPLSNSYKQDLESFKSNSVYVNLLQFNKSSLQKFISVSSSEISTYLKDEKSLNKVKSQFKSRKKSLDVQEQLKAKHILLTTQNEKEEEVSKKINDIHKKLTNKNFAKMANKYTQDPSGKDKGGSLNWFSKGRMVPEFEAVAFKMKKGEISKPVKTSYGYHIIMLEDKKSFKAAKLEDHQQEIAKELLQKSKTKEQDELVNNLKQKISSLLNNNDLKGVDKINKKYGFTLLKSQKINQLEGIKSGPLKLSNDEVMEIFNQKNTNKVQELKDITKVTLLKVVPNPKNKEEKKEDNSYISTHQGFLTGKLSEELLKELESNTKVKIFPKLL